MGEGGPGLQKCCWKLSLHSLDKNEAIRVHDE